MKDQDIKNKFLTALEQLVIFNDFEKDLLMKYISPFYVKKGEIYQSEGDIPQYMSFVLDGLMRKFVYSEDGVDLTLDFSLVPGVFTSYDEFIAQKPAKEYIQAMTDGVIMQIHHKNFEILFKKSDAVKNYTIKIMQIMIKNAQERIYDMTHKSAAQRYVKLLDCHQDKLGNIPLMHISSYLGIRPQSLSRLRKVK